ncbi:MAG: nucleoside hydrolase [Ktedonobacteraceae bacterium]
MKHKIILDCDPGHDDAIAILLAAHHPEIDLLAITTVAGNQSLDKTTRNALKVCSFAGLRSIPIAQGASCPLVCVAKHAENIHGESGLDGPSIPEADIEPMEMDAVELIIERLLQSDGDITLVATGPLTNLATAIRSEPAILPKIKGISLMGGAIGLGNTTPAAEFNIHFDPHAAAIVFGCGRPIFMAPLEVTHQALASKHVIDRLRRANRPVATFASDLFEFFGGTYQKVFGFPAAPVHDPCAVAAVVNPSLIKSHLMHVAVETKGEWTLGRTVCDVYGKFGNEPNASVGYSLEVESFWDMVIEALTSY